MKALILAAGLGIRLGKLTSDKPKALVDVGGKKLIDRTLAFIEQKIDTIGVVGGYHSELLKEYLSSKKVSFFENPDFKAGNILTLRAALNFIDDDTLILNVDHIYPQKMLSHILSNSSGITAICDFDRQLVEDDMKVKLNSRNELMKISKTLSDYDCGYIGMTFIAANMIDTYKSALADTVDIYGKSSCVEFILGHIAANGIPVNICDTSGYRWLEVDTQEDLNNAEKKLRKADTYE